MSRKMQKILIILSQVLVVSIALTSLGIAYAGELRGVGLMGVCFFQTFGIILVIAQLIPSGIILSSFAGIAFSSFRKSEIPGRAA